MNISKNKKENGLGASFSLSSEVSAALKTKRNSFLSSHRQDGNSIHPLKSSSSSKFLGVNEIVSNFSDKLTFLSPLPNETSSDPVDLNEGHNRDDENDIIPFKPNEENIFVKENDDNETVDSNIEKVNNEKDSDDENSESGKSESTTISLSPPTNLPIMIINLKQIYGYVPTNEEDVQKLKQEVTDELLGKKKEDSKDKDTNEVSNNGELREIGDGTSLDFIPRSSLLFESGVAIHASFPLSPNSNQEQNMLSALMDPKVVQEILQRFALDANNNMENDDSISSAPQISYDQFHILPYPEFIYDPQSSKAEPLNKLWKFILQKHPIPVIQTILQHLQNTSQPILWKYQMAQEIRTLAHTYREQKKERDTKKALYKWKTETRPEQLEQCYKVRETFETQLELAEDHLHHLERQRERMVKERMREYVRRIGDDSELMDVLNLGQGELLRPSVDDLFLGLGGHNVNQNNDSSFDSDSSSHQYNGDLEEDDEEVYDASDEENDTTAHFSTTHDDKSLLLKPPSSSSSSEHAEIILNQVPKDDAKNLFPQAPDAAARRRRRRRRRDRKFSKKQQQQQYYRAKMSARKETIEAAKKEEAKIRQELTTSDLQMAQLIVNTLKAKYTQVDELLESLQEEEWADAENPGDEDEFDLYYDENNEGQYEGDQGENLEESGSMTLLDQILAMILGKLPRLRDMNERDHYKMIQSEHSQIVTKWKEYFGTLPHNPYSKSGKKEEKDERLEEPISQQQQKENDNNEKVEGALVAIAQNDGDENWDELDWEELLPEVKIENNGRGHELIKEEKLDESTTSGLDDEKRDCTKTKARKVGLRPGGRIS